MVGGVPREVWSSYVNLLGGGFEELCVYFHSYLGKILILTNIFQTGWNHHLGVNRISRKKSPIPKRVIILDIKHRIF